MTMKRAILEIGMGNDLHGGDYTKAAQRAVNDALHHSSLSFIRTLNIDKKKLYVNVTIGVQNPESVDIDKIRASLPIIGTKSSSDNSSVPSGRLGKTK